MGICERVGHVDVPNSHSTRHSVCGSSVCQIYAQPKESHTLTQSVRFVGTLAGTRKRGTRFSRKVSEAHGVSVNCFVDASFAPVWNQFEDDDNAKSQTGYA